MSEQTSLDVSTPPVQPSGDARATAIAVAYQLAGGFVLANDSAQREESARRQAKLVGELARALLVATAPTTRPRR